MQINELKNRIEWELNDLYLQFHERNTLSEHEKGEIYAYKNLLRLFENKEKETWKPLQDFCKVIR